MKIRIGHLFPDLLNLYGDRGNIQCLLKRCHWRGIEAECQAFMIDDPIDLTDLDILLLGGGSDREQLLVCDRLLQEKEELTAYVRDGGVLLAVCGGYQLLGNFYRTREAEIRGLSLIDMDTVQEEGRLIGNVVVESDLFDMPVVGFENHGGRTRIGENKPLGRVLYGKGNDGRSGYEGVVFENVIGTYLHGPLLPKNPQLADELICRAIGRRQGSGALLPPLPDEEERQANAYIVRRFVPSKAR